MSGAVNTFFTYKFLRTLTQAWEDTDAFKLGIIDNNGKALKKVRELKTPEEKDAYSIFHRLVYNIKRVFNKVPLGNTRIASYIAALYLLKEKYGATDDNLDYIFEQLEISVEYNLNESKKFFFNEDNQLMPGKYTLVNTIISPITGEETGLNGHTVSVEKFSDPVDTIFGYNIYEAKHVISGQTIYISAEDIKR